MATKKAATSSRTVSAKNAVSPKRTATKKNLDALKLYVLDTSVLLHDPTCLMRFNEHNLCIPFVTLEELDNNKTGTSDKNRNARQAIRLIEQIVEGGTDHSAGFPLSVIAGPGAGRLFIREDASADLLSSFESKFDNRFIALMQELKTKEPLTQAILVSKDLNLRIKAAAVGCHAEDYKSDKVIEDSDLLWRGHRSVSEDFLSTHLLDVEGSSWTGEHGWPHYRVQQPKQPLLPNEFIVMTNGEIYSAYDCDAKTACLRLRTDHQHKDVWGVKAKNDEQSMALSLLTDPNIDFVTLLGPAGTGKTLLTLAAGLQQVLESKKFAEIIFTRATVPLGDDIGFLPGTEEEKMMPWLGAMQDNLDALTGNTGNTDWKHAATRELVMSKVKVKSISFMRGRTFHSKFVIIDEAQNLTAKQMKALITRAGDDTKVVCLGNLSQIDTPYLSESNSGLAYAAERFKGWAHYGHVILKKGERSRLASYANDHM